MACAAVIKTEEEGGGRGREGEGKLKRPRGKTDPSASGRRVGIRKDCLIRSIIYGR